MLACWNRLTEVAMASLYDKDKGDVDTTTNSKIYHIIRSLAFSGSSDGNAGELSINYVRERVLAKGFTEDNLLEAIRTYEELDVSDNLPLTFLSVTDDNDRCGKLRMVGLSWCSYKLEMMRMSTRMRKGWMWTCDLNTSCWFLMFWKICKTHAPRIPNVR